MTQVPPPQIRPGWLIGGVFGGIVLGACALISVCSAAALIWFSVQRSENVNTVTETEVLRQTEQAVVAVPTRPTRTLTAPTSIQPSPTRLLIPTSIQPSPALLLVPTTITALRSSPDQAVRTYYQLVSNQDYATSWSLLSEPFKQKFNCCAPNYNYTGYVDWWNSVNYVDFGSVAVVSQSENRAVVYAELYFVMNTGERTGMDTNPYIQLVLDPVSGNWQFDDKRASP